MLYRVHWYTMGIIKSTKPIEAVQMKLKQLGSNMAELATNSGAVILFSYSTPVAAMLPSGQYVKSSEWYSQTTTRHINKWLQGVFADVETRSPEFISNLTEKVA